MKPPKDLVRFNLHELFPDADPEAQELDAIHGALCVDASHQRLYVAIDEAVHALDLHHGTLLRSYPLDIGDIDPIAGYCLTLQTTPDGRFLVAAFSEGNGGESWSALNVFDVASGRLRAHPAMPDHLQAIALDPAGERLLCTGPYRLEVLRARDGKCLLREDTRDAPYDFALWDPTDDSILVGADSTLTRRDPRTLAARESFPLPKDFAAWNVFARRTAARLAPTQLPTMTLPTGVVLWADAADSLLWLSDDGARAIVRDEHGTSLRAAGRRARSLDQSGDGDRGAYLNLAASRDGTLLAVRREGLVAVRATSLDAASAPA